MTPGFRYNLPSRVAGSFGSSKPGKIAEFVTLSWLRLELTLCWAASVALAIVGPSPAISGLGDRVYLVLLSPIAAIMLWLTLKAVSLVLYFVPGVGMVWGLLRICFVRLFSRLIVQPAPTIVMPVWRSG